MHLNYLGLVSCFLHPEFPSRGTTDWGREGGVGGTEATVAAGLKKETFIVCWTGRQHLFTELVGNIFFVRTCIYVINLWFSPVNMSHVNFNS